MHVEYRYDHTDKTVSLHIVIHSKSQDPAVFYTKLNLKVNICGADFSFCLSRAEGGDAAHR